MPSLGTHHLHQRLGIEGINLEIEPSPVGQCLLGIVGYMPIEYQRVVIGDEKGYLWLMLHHVALHLCLLVPADVWGVRDDDV